MSTPLFDPRRRILHRRRAKRLGDDLFLHARALEDIVDRLIARGTRADTALLVGPVGRAPLVPFAASLGHASTIASIDAAPDSLDLIVLLGELDAVDELDATAFALRHLLRPGGTLAGCVVGGDSLPRLRHALLEADRAAGKAARRVHPMLDGPSLSSLLQSAGFGHPVIEVDRVTVAYPSFDKLIADLRAMACTSALADAAPPLTRNQLEVARTAFLDGNDRTVERFDLLHFTASAP